jgi:hypothetical protein
LDRFNAEREERERQKDQEQSLQRSRAAVEGMPSSDDSLVSPSLKDRQESIRVLVPYLTTPSW